MDQVDITDRVAFESVHGDAALAAFPPPLPAALAADGTRKNIQPAPPPIPTAALLAHAPRTSRAATLPPPLPAARRPRATVPPPTPEPTPATTAPAMWTDSIQWFETTDKVAPLPAEGEHAQTTYFDRAEPSRDPRARRRTLAIAGGVGAFALVCTLVALPGGDGKVAGAIASVHASAPVTAPARIAMPAPVPVAAATRVAAPAPIDESVVLDAPAPPAVAPRPRPRPAARVAATAPATGVLAIATKPPCEIFIDGKPTHLATPQRALKLTAGRHQIALVNASQHLQHTVAVQIDPRQPTKIIQDYTKH